MLRSARARRRLKTVAGRIAGKRRVLVELAHRLGARVAGESQVGNAVWRVKRRAAAAACQVGPSRAAHAGQASSSRNRSIAQKIA